MNAAPRGRGTRIARAAGYDFIKLHPGLRPEVFDAIAAAAHDSGMPFSGHVPEDVGVLHALAAGQRAVDHLDGYLQALAGPGCIDGPMAAGIFGIGLTRCADAARIPAVVAATREAGTWMAPTQVLLERWASPPTPEQLAAEPASRHVSAATRLQWYVARARFLGTQPLPRDMARKFVSLRRELIRQLHAAGVPILLASDAPQAFNVPGDSALAELAVYVACGLDSHEALLTATVNPARFFGAEAVFGSVREGLDADLVLLAADPLQDVGNLRRIEGVMLRGRWLDRRELEARLEALAGRPD